MQAFAHRREDEGQPRRRSRPPADTPAEIPLDPGFIGFGRAAVDAEGSVRTLRPGRVPVRIGGKVRQAPHVAVGVFGRGLLERLATRLGFADGAGQGEAVFFDP